MAMFPWWRSLDHLLAQGPALLHVIGAWGPGLLCCAAGVRVLTHRNGPANERRPLLLALVAVTLLAQLPVLTRPMAQISASMPLAGLLAAVLIDDLILNRPVARASAGLMAAGLLMYALTVARPVIAASMPNKYLCLPSLFKGNPSTLSRLGNLRLPPSKQRELHAMVSLVAEVCPEGQRIYLAAPFYSHLCFLSGRPGLLPYLTSSRVARTSDREAVVKTLDREKPPVALITEQGIDLPFALEHAEEWAYIQQHYRLHRQIGDLQVYVRRVNGQATPAAPVK